MLILFLTKRAPVPDMDAGALFFARRERIGMNRKEYKRRRNTAECRLRIEQRLSEELTLELIEVIQYEKKQATEDEKKGIQAFMQLLHMYQDSPDVAPYGERQLFQMLIDHFGNGVSFTDLLMYMCNRKGKRSEADRQARIMSLFRSLKGISSQSEAIHRAKEAIRELQGQLDEMKDSVASVRAVDPSAVRLENASGKDHMIGYLTKKQRLEEAIELQEEWIRVLIAHNERMKELLDSMPAQDRYQLRLADPAPDERTMGVLEKYL